MKSEKVKTQTNNIELTIRKDINEIKYEEKTIFLCPAFFLCKDENDKYFLFMENNYYQINPEQKSNEVGSLTLLKTLPFNANYNGFIREKKFDQSHIVENARSNINENEIIIYGKKGSKFYFYYIKESDYEIAISTAGEKISCKLIESVWYICAHFQSNKIKISILVHIYISTGEKGFKIVDTKDAEGFSDIEYDNLILYDTTNDKYKILCASKRDDSIKCSAIHITVNYEYHLWGADFNYELNFIVLKREYQISLSEEHKCYLTGFYSEFLSCCAEGSIITCYRNDKNNFALINIF